jgi:GNAT superfamily N-acetyltransferase
MAFRNGEFIGNLTINWQSNYPPFQQDKVPELKGFNVLPNFQRQGIGTRLMDEAERIVVERSMIVGIGVGLFSDYGAAQRMASASSCVLIQLQTATWLHFRNRPMEWKPSSSR